MLFRSFGGISGIIGGLGSFLGIGGGASTGGAAMGAEFFTPEAIASMVWLHKGGVVGMEGKGGYAPASLFNNAPRLHRGISSDEAPVILQKGETVLPRGAGNIVINMNVKGSIVTERELARTLVPLISKAQREGAH